MVHAPVNDFYIYMGARLRCAREEQGKKQKDISAALEKTDGWVSLVEQGNQRLFVNDLVAWCAYLGIDPGEVLKQAANDDPSMT